MLQKIKYSIKIIIAYTLYLSGLLNLLIRYRLNNKVVVLMYHRILPIDVLDRSFSAPGIIVSPNTFDIHVKYLKNKFSILSINQFSNHIMAGESLNGFNCIITFDDGWEDNYTYAFPILKKYKANSIVFLPADYISQDKIFWQENLSCLIYHILLEKEKYYPIIAKYDLGWVFDENIGTQKRNTLLTISFIKNKPYSYINKMISDLCMAMDVPSNFSHHVSIDRYLTWDQINTMSSSNVSFGSHAVSHKILPKLSDNDINNEISQSKAILNSKIGAAIDSIAYPNGDYNKIVIEATKNNGYIMGFSTEPGYYSQGDNPFCIKRINIHDDATRNIPMLLCRILEIF